MPRLLEYSHVEVATGGKMGHETGQGKTQTQMQSGSSTIEYTVLRKH